MPFGGAVCTRDVSFHPEWPGRVLAGDTDAEARSNVEEAIPLYLASTT